MGEEVGEMCRAAQGHIVPDGHHMGPYSSVLHLVQSPSSWATGVAPGPPPRVTSEVT